MTLFQILMNTESYSSSCGVVAVKPWTAESEARVISMSQAWQATENAGDTENFFLSMIQIKALLQQLECCNTCLEAQCQKIIEFALEYESR